MAPPRRTFTITKLERAPEGWWRARVTCDGTTVEVDRRHGSWLAQVRVARGARTFHTREVLPHVAAALQAKLPREQRAGRKAAA